MKERKIVWVVLFSYLFVLGYQIAGLKADTEVRGREYGEYETASIQYAEKKRQEKSDASDTLTAMLHAKSAVLMDGYTGRILYGKNEREQLPMASTTKIMTCILTLESADWEEIVEVSPYAASMPDVQLNICAGEQYRLKDLLLSLMLESHNDSAAAIAEYIGEKAVKQGIVDWTGENTLAEAGKRSMEESKGLVMAFAELMNQKALELGCEHTCFLTPNGLDASMAVEEEGKTKEVMHSTTAAELAAMMRYCVSESEKAEQFLEITRTKDASFNDLAGKRNFSCVNHNRYLDMRAGALSGKTGFTGKAGYCYVGAVKEGENYLIVALLACGWPPSKTWKWQDMEKLVHYGVEQYQYVKTGESSEHCFRYRMPVCDEKGRKTGWIDLKTKISRKPLEALMREDEKQESWWYLDLPMKALEGKSVSADAGWYETKIEDTVVQREKLTWYR